MGIPTANPGMKTSPAAKPEGRAYEATFADGGKEEDAPISPFVPPWAGGRSRPKAVVRRNPACTRTGHLRNCAPRRASRGCGASSYGAPQPVISRRFTAGWFTEGFDTADLKDAKALLKERA